MEHYNQHKVEATMSAKRNQKVNVLRITGMRSLKNYITIDPEIQNGQPVFAGTRVPVESLFWHLEKGIPIDEFLEDFPSVTKEQAIGVLEIANKIFASSKIDQIYEAIAG
ncbi:MAG: DUF433 domain-containing protein [Bacteroidota bacterium]